MCGVPTRRETEFEAWQRAQRQRQGFAVRAAGGRSPYSFTPYSPPPIPSGYYDPALDAQRDAASRGLLHTEQDTGLAGRRSQEDLATGMETIDRDWTRQQQDIGVGRERVVADYNRNVQMLQRSFQQLGRRQGEQARRYGVSSGGVALLSAAKRGENQALEQRDLDTARERAAADFRTREAQIAQDRDLARQGLTTAYDRGVADRGTGLGRARGEDLFYGLDVDRQKLYQAQQAGYDAPTGPRNEFRRPDGSTYRVVKRDGWRLEVDPSGRVLSRRRAR